MMPTSGATRKLPTPRTSAVEFRLEMLDLLPCGCVVAVERMPISGVRIVSLEAKGPHCPFAEHRANKVIRLGDPADLYDTGDDMEDDRVA